MSGRYDLRNHSASQTWGKGDGTYHCMSHGGIPALQALRFAHVQRGTKG